MPTYISLLRAINVGGRNPVKMAALRDLHGSLGLAPVQTLIQSGNVVFKAKERNSKRLKQTLEDAIEKAFGHRPEVILRSTGQLRQIIQRNPWPELAKSDPGRLIVMFLSGSPDQAAQQRLDEKHKGPEVIAYSGEELYLHYPAGMGRSKLTNVLIEKQLRTSGTARNWNTVTKLLDMAEAL